MKICHAITRLIVGGAQENTVLTCAGLVRRGHRVTLVAGPETGPEGSLWAEAERSGATLVRLPHLLRNPHPYHDVRCRSVLTRMLREGGFDVVHTHSSKAGIVGRMAAHRAKVPAVVHTIHGMSFNRTQSPPARWFYRALERRVAPYTHRFVTVAHAMADQAVGAGLAERRRFVTVYSGMRVQDYRPDSGRRRAVRREWGVHDDHVVVGTVARLFRNKGYEQLLAAMPAALANVPELRFVWVGDGAQRDEYLQSARQAGVADKVHLTGLVPPSAVPELVGGFDVVVHASRWEGLPRALVQGLLMSVPGVAFDIDGAPEVIIDGDTGVLVPYADTAALAAAVVRLARDTALRRRLGAEGRRRCLERFSDQAMVSQLEDIYRQLVGSYER